MGKLTGANDGGEMQELKRQLVGAIMLAIDKRNLSQEGAAAIMGVYQCDISNLKHGKRYRHFSVTRLFFMLNRLGYAVNIKVESTGERSKAGETTLVLPESLKGWETPQNGKKT